MVQSLKTDEILVNMGPQHPSTHGVLRCLLKTDGEWVREVWPYIGYLHRCKEKIAEKVSYIQFMPYTDRLDYLASANNNLGWAMAVERLTSIEVPERAVWLRVLAAELNRIASHLLSYGTFGMEAGAFTPFFYGFRERETIVSIFDQLCGARLTYHYARIGGVMRDLSPETAKAIRRFLDEMDRRWVEYNTLLSDNEIFVRRTANVGVIPADLAIAYGLTGPVLRGSGVAHDIRKAAPYACYPKLDFKVCVGEGLKGTVGDCWDRYWVRMLEIRESVKICRQILDGLPEGPYQAKVPRILKVLANEAYVRTEAPRGELGFYIISDGTDKPWRCRIRAPSFCNLSILNRIARNCLVADVIMILGSIDVVMGEVDR
ncbi:MAG: NADH-quinone oxidoreductase subunit D [Candidatus Sumerlaeia bacterium]|nr:NADH-quinone oxidoreductase subunit D [Candidatus Sumerlaeia bacterium]